MRIDKLLWFLRLARTRSAAQVLVGAGHIRLNGRRVERAAQVVHPGDTLTLPQPCGVSVVAIVALPSRRGPAPEAQACYRVLDATLANPIAADQSTKPEGTDLP